MNLTRAGLQPFVDEGWINCQKHPTEELYLFNYSKTCGFSRHWIPETLACRGLIIDGEDNIVARPFPKFFNLEEHDPNEPFLFSKFTTTEKLDGSLGIYYEYPMGQAIATRGSFTSDQALRATKILNEKYGGWYPMVDYATPLFEIILPENRIVIDYGNMEDIILLAVIDKETGIDLPLEIVDWTGPVVSDYNSSQVAVFEISDTFGVNDGQNEGFVLRFEHNGETPRVKVKLEEYKRLHRIITQTSNKTIWEALSQDKSLEEILDRVPDEFNDFVQETISSLRAQYLAIASDASLEFFNVLELLPTNYSRKDFAIAIKDSKYQAILFLMLDDRDYRSLIWKMIKPEYSRPFAKDVDSG